MAALTELRNRVRSGDVSIVGSRLYKNFDEYLIPREDWAQITAGTTIGDLLAVSSKRNILIFTTNIPIK